MPIRKTAEQKAEPKATAKKETAPKKPIVEKFPLTEKAKKFIEKVEPGLSNLIFEAREIEAGKQGEGKHRIVFMCFSPEPKSATHEEMTVEDNDFNKEKIKEVLFYYHTSRDVSDSGLELLQVVAPEKDDEDNYHLLAYQEITEK